MDSATFFATRFDTDDLGHRILTLLQMMAAAAMAVNVP
jgi:low temperature requirement protein LtrA